MGAHVLVVDDEDTITLCLEHLLQNHGYHVSIARDGAAAIEQLSTGPLPDLVLLDVMMPGRTGFDICQTLRHSYPSADLKIVMISAKCRDVDLEKGLALGADAYVAKPFTQKDIEDAVQSVLTRREQDASQHSAAGAL